MFELLQHVGFAVGLVDLDRVRWPVAELYERLATETVLDGFPRAIAEGGEAAA